MAGFDGVAKSRTRLRDFTSTFHFHALEKEMAAHSCLENPRDGESWWAAIYGVAQSRTRLKRLSSSSSSDQDEGCCGTSGEGGLPNFSFSADDR